MTAEKGYVVEVDRSGCIAAAGAGKGASLGSAERRLYTFGSTYGGTASGRTQEQDYYYLLLLPASPVLRHIQHFVPPLNQPSSHINLTRTRIRHGEQLRILLLSSHRGASTIKIRQPTSTSYTIHCLFAMPNNTGTRRFAKGFWNIWKPD